MIFMNGTKKVWLASLVKQENNYLLEWVDHYRKIGVDKILLCDNNDKDGERPQDVLQDYVDEGYVIVRDFRGQKFDQTKVLSQMYREYSYLFDWLCVFDVDEFLFFRNKDLTIQEWLSQKKFDGHDAIRIPWIVYDDNGLLDVGEDGDYSCLNRFTHKMAVNRWNEINARTTKSILRSGVESIRRVNEHGTYDTQNVVDCNGVLCGSRTTCFRKPTKNPDAWLNHYRTKTIGEFFRKKLRPGYGYRNVGNTVKFFFSINKDTWAKREYLSQLQKGLIK